MARAVSFLALDLGERRIGLAVSDPLGSMALPHSMIERTNVRDDIERIVALIAERGVQEVVIGYPLTLEGKPSIAAEKVDAFIAHLERRFPGPIHRSDERMTTALANKALIAADVSRAKRKQVVDQIAAANILETFLARRSREKTS